MANRYFSNTSKLMALTLGISPSDTVMTVDDASGLPVLFPFFLAIDADTSSVEIVKVTAAAGPTLTIVRGQQDTSAKSHAGSAPVFHAWTAQDGTDAETHYATAVAVHGLTGTVVGTSDSQTLTNKTMSGSSNTFSNIPGSAIANSPTLHNLDVDNAASSADNVISADPIVGTIAATILSKFRTNGAAVRTETSPGALSTGVHITCFNGVSNVFEVNYQGDTTIAGTTLCNGQLFVSASTSTMRDVTMNQRQVTQPALTVTASASSPSATLVRFTPDDGTPALDLKRSSTANPTQPIMRVLSQADVVLMQLNRDGSFGNLTTGNLTTGTISASGALTVSSGGYNVTGNSVVSGTITATNFIIASGSRSVSGELDTLAAQQLLAIRTADGTTINSNTTLANDGVLAFALLANSTYRFQLDLLYTTPTAADIKIGWTGPAGFTMRWGGMGFNTSEVWTAFGGLTESTQPAFGGSGSTDLYARLVGEVTTTGNAGTLNLQVAQQTSNAGNTIVRAGSTLIAEKN